MSAPIDLSRDDSHPRAREALAEPFFWDAEDPCAPFGGETGQEVLEAFRDFRVEDPRGAPLSLLADLLARWEVADASWDAVDEDEVQAVGADDELGLLVRDEAILALAFAQIVEEGRLDPEVRRRALLAVTRQSLPALLHGWGDRAHARRERLSAMREALSRRWD